MKILQHAIHDVQKMELLQYSGKITSLKGLRIEITAPAPSLNIGSIAHLNHPETGPKAELVGFNKHQGILLACDPTDHITPGKPVYFCNPETNRPRPCHEWLGRTIGAFAEPKDNKGKLPQGPRPIPLNPPPINPASRNRLGKYIDLGIRILNVFTPCAAGQRLGLFAGSGIGKSTLLSMLAKHCNADIIVIGMIGERGREIREFIEDSLGNSGLARSVIITSTSDEPAPRRRRAARLTLAIAEYFRDCGMNVLCLLDSVTRFAHAQREIGLAAGEPPVSRGYTPSVLTELPRLLERAGPGSNAGTITAFFTVLVEGDDHDEPISDAVRGILDGHVVMSRKIAERGRHPAIDPLRSISRLETKLLDQEQNNLLAQTRRLLAIHSDMEELIRVGAYTKGNDDELDRAIQIMPELNQFMAQHPDSFCSRNDAFSQLNSLIHKTSTTEIQTTT